MFIDCIVKIENLILPDKVVYVRKNFDKKTMSVIIREPNKTKLASERRLESFIKGSKLQNIEEEQPVFGRSSISLKKKPLYESQHFKYEAPKILSFKAKNPECSAHCLASKSLTSSINNTNNSKASFFNRAPKGKSIDRQRKSVSISRRFSEMKRMVMEEKRHISEERSID